MFQFGFVFYLKCFFDNEVKKGQYIMKLWFFKEQVDQFEWFKFSNDFFVISWDDFKVEVKECFFVVIYGFIYDCFFFVEDYFGGVYFIKCVIGIDVIIVFFGGVYDYFNVVYNLFVMMCVGIFDGGMEVEYFK